MLTSLLMLLQDVDVPEQAETAQPTVQDAAGTPTSQRQPDGVSPAQRREQDEPAEGHMASKSAPCDVFEEEAAPAVDAAAAVAEDSDASFRRTQSDTEVVRSYTLVPRQCFHNIATSHLHNMPKKTNSI